MSVGRDDRLERLRGWERVLLVLPLAGGTVFGLAPLLVPGPFAALTGGSGNDPVIYRFAGAATFGYAPALALGIAQGAWRPVRLPVVAVLVFNLASLYAGALEILGGRAPLVVYLILVTSLALVAIGAGLLYRHRALGPSAPDVAAWLVYFILLLTVVAATAALLALFGPVPFGKLFGYEATDVFVYRQAGAATLGYAVMGIFETRSRAWLDMRLPLVMALVFNGASVLVGVYAIANAEPGWLPLVTTPAALVATLGSYIALRRRGR